MTGASVISGIIVLVGPPGALVPETARALAARLGTEVRDTDRDVERQAGKPVGDIFVEDGEAAFRALEREAALRALTSQPDNSKKSDNSKKPAGADAPADNSKKRAGARESAADNSKIVVALGSGAVLDEAVRERLAGSTVVYLAADFGTVARHAGLDKPRVVLPGNPRGRLRAMLDERARTYASLATITVQSEDASGPEDLAEQIERAMNR